MVREGFWPLLRFVVPLLSDFDDGVKKQFKALLAIGLGSVGP